MLSLCLFSPVMIILTFLLATSTSGLIPPVDVQLRDGTPPCIPNVLVRTNSSVFEVNGYLTMNPQCFIRSRILHNTTFTGEVSLTNNLTICSESYIGDRPPAGDAITMVAAGIGPGSNLLSLYDSISFVKGHDAQNASLIVGASSLDQFEQSCVVGSMLRIPHTPTTNGSIVELEFSWVWPGRRSSETDGRPMAIMQGPRTQVVLGGEAKMLIIPGSFASPILAIILASGAIRNTTASTLFFNNCIYGDLVAQLPLLIVNLQGTENFFTLYPDDYFRFRVPENECYPNFAVSPSSTDSLSFNPLMIPNMNIHITNDELRVCDSL